MQSNDYTVRYICPECGGTRLISQMGAASDVIKTLPRMVKQIFCAKCRTKQDGTKMDVLNIKCRIKKDDAKKNFWLGWKCSKCGAQWSTYEQLSRSQLVAKIGMNKDKESKCITAKCDANPEEIRMVRMKSA